MNFFRSLQNPEESLDQGEDKPFFQRPVVRIILVFIAQLILYIVFRSLGAFSELFPDPTPGLIIELALPIAYLLFLNFWLFFFAQFVLPVRTLGDRNRAYDRLVQYITGQHGPAVFIENGRIRRRESDKKRRGPGVILLDSASAAVLRKEVEYTRTVGPGLVFSERAEYINDEDAVDLHRIRISIGPKDPTEDPQDQPFLPPKPEETESSYQQRMRRKEATLAQTRDGIDIVPTITIEFQIDVEPGTGDTPFGYHPESVFRAATSLTIAAQAATGEKKYLVPWYRLPSMLAVDLWREYTRKFTLFDLFHEQGTGETALQVIHRMVNERLTQPEVDEYDPVGNPTGRRVVSREYSLLQSKGVKVYSVYFTNLNLRPEIDARLEENWRSTWLIQAKREKELLEQQRSYRQEHGKAEALQDYAAYISHYLSQVTEPEKTTLNEALRRAVRGSLLACVREAKLHKKLSKEKEQLLEIIEWAGQETQTPNKGTNGNP